MIHETHDLLHELPEHAEKIRCLQIEDPEFLETLAHYDRIDQEIQDAELSGTPIDDATFEGLKKRRLAIKDTLFQRILAG